MLNLSRFLFLTLALSGLSLAKTMAQPVIIKNGGDTVYLNQCAQFDFAAPKAIDPVDGDISGNIVTKQEPKINMYVAGAYKFTYKVANSKMQEATAVQIFVVMPDKKAPDLELKGDTLVDLAIDEMFVETGFSASDNCDGDLTASVAVINNVNTHIAGIYYITYKVSDMAGNKTEKTRRVRVKYKEAPRLKLLGDKNVVIAQCATYAEPGFSAWDTLYGDLTKSVTVNIPTALTKGDTGTYKITYSVTNADNLTTTAERTVRRRAGSQPTITLNGADTVYVEINETYNDAGATGYDTCGLDSTITSGTVNIYKLGENQLTYIARNKTGQQVSINRTVIVRDTKAPVIKLNGELTATIGQCCDYTDAGATVTDNSGEKPALIQEGTLIKYGTKYTGIYTIRYKAVDKSGNIGYSEWRVIQIVSAEQMGESACACSSSVANSQINKLNIKIFPTASTGRFELSGLEAFSACDLRVYNSIGQEVAHKPLSGNGTLDLSHLPGGTYNVLATQGASLGVQRVIIIK